MRTWYLALCVWLIGGLLGAQSCNGAASFGTGQFRVGAGASSTDGAKTYGGEAAIGQHRGAFGRLGLSTVDFDEFEGPVTGFDVTGGGANTLGSAERVEVCAVAGFAARSGSNLRTSSGLLDLDVMAYSFGLAAGGTIPLGQIIDLVPSLQAAGVITSTTLDINGMRGTRKEDFVNVRVGGGLVFNGTFTVLPSVSVPFGLKDSNPLYAIGIGYNFGYASQPRPRR